MGTTGDFLRARDEFRRHPYINNNFRRATPGLGIALVAFGAYLLIEGVYDKFSKPKHSSDHAHH